MANSVRATLILRNDLAATWASQNPVLARGEIGVEIDTGLLKLGDGSTRFNNLGYINHGKDGDGALITNYNNTLTIANYGVSYWMYDNETMREIEVQESDLTQWPQTLELEIKNGVARWVVPKINYDRAQGRLDGALITLARDPMYSTEATTKNYVDTAVANAIINAPHLKRQIVNELPQTHLDVNTIYMIKDNSVTGGDKYKEYLVINNELVQIGDTSVDLTNYMEKVDNATAGNIPMLAADGTLVDSGVSINNVHNLPIATASTLGGVYSSNLDNYVSVTNLGYLQVNRISTDKLYVPNNSEFILNGGGA